MNCESPTDNNQEGTQVESLTKDESLLRQQQQFSASKQKNFERDYLKNNFYIYQKEWLQNLKDKNK